MIASLSSVLYFRAGSMWLIAYEQRGNRLEFFEGNACHVRHLNGVKIYHFKAKTSRIFINTFFTFFLGLRNGCKSQKERDVEG